MSLANSVETILAELEAFVREAPLPSCCPLCDSKGCLRWDGFRPRCASFQVEDRTVYVARFRLRRFDCRSCGQSSTLYPPTILPRRRYQLCVVLHAIVGLLADPARDEAAVAAAHDCARRTVGRWLRWLRGLDPAALAQRLLAVTGEALLPGVGWAQRRIEAARCAARRALLSGGAEVVSLLEALASATGRAPAEIVPEFAR